MQPGSMNGDISAEVHNNGRVIRVDGRLADIICALVQDRELRRYLAVTKHGSVQVHFTLGRIEVKPTICTSEQPTGKGLTD